MCKVLVKIKKAPVNEQILNYIKELKIHVLFARVIKIFLSPVCDEFLRTPRYPRMALFVSGSVLPVLFISLQKDRVFHPDQ
ncbi:MAG TPA: hypothetical protein VFI33_20350 [Puia sp.]|nr:hypothetical protein [Puia sp.]